MDLDTPSRENWWPIGFTTTSACKPTFLESSVCGELSRTPAEIHDAAGQSHGSSTADDDIQRRTMQKTIPSSFPCNSTCIDAVGALSWPIGYNGNTLFEAQASGKVTAMADYGHWGGPSEVGALKDIGKSEAELLELCATDKIVHTRADGKIQIKYLVSKDKNGRLRQRLVYAKK